jgi:hypothetical protein
MIEYYDKEGNAITAQEWAELFEDMEYRRIAYTELPNGTTVSTVWLGLVHGHGPNGPLVYETMVKHKGDDWDEQYRYATEDEAKVGHKARVYTHSDGDSPQGEENRWSQISNEEEDF